MDEQERLNRIAAALREAYSLVEEGSEAHGYIAEALAYADGDLGSFDEKVIIEVRGGIPEIIEAPDGVDVEIRDYDTEFYEDEDLLEDDAGEKYFLRED